MENDRKRSNGIYQKSKGGLNEKRTRNRKEIERCILERDIKEYQVPSGVCITTGFGLLDGHYKRR